MYEREGCWPTRQQELLLRAALLQRKESLDAWHEWKSSVDFDQLDPGSLRLLPLLFQNLRTHGEKDPLRNRFKETYQITWYKNKMIFHNMAILLRSFQNAGIQTMVLKGAALTILHYRDYGLRPMGDFDVLIPTEQTQAAFNLLKTLGWTSRSRSPEAFISVRHAHNYTDEAGQGFDLHWHLLLECCYENADDDFWNSSVPLQVGDIISCTLCPTDQLFHACIHGVMWNVLPPLRWVADSMMVLKTSEDDIDWDRLVTLARERYLVLRLTEALTYLHTQLKAPIPGTVLKDLQDSTISNTERREHLSRCRPSRFGQLPSLWYHYKALKKRRREWNIQSKFMGFPTYLQHVWGLEHFWQLPVSIIVKGKQRLRT